MKKLIIAACLLGFASCKPKNVPTPQTDSLVGTKWVKEYTGAPWSKSVEFSSRDCIEIRMFVNGQQMMYEEYLYIYGRPEFWVDGRLGQPFKGLYYGDSLMLQGEMYYKEL